jgi:hypothetical protein
MAQFIVVPPLSRIQLLFEKVTSCRFVKETGWKSWHPTETTDYEWLYEYIRPSHQKLLNETIDGIQETPCSLLRQLLRPHDYRIERTNYGWTLKEGRKSVSPSKISVRTGVMIWSSEDSV